LYLGSEAWMAKMREQIGLKPRCDEHPRAQRLAEKATMSAVVSGVAVCLSIDEERVRYSRGGVPRMLAAWIGRNEALLTNSEVAAGLRIRSATQVTRLVRQCDRELDQNPTLRGWLDRCVSTIRRKEVKG
jgi:hypothetical protein